MNKGDAPVQEIWQPNITAWTVILADLSADFADYTDEDRESLKSRQMKGLRV
jgi:hypothetical protein